MVDNQSSDERKQRRDSGGPPEEKQRRDRGGLADGPQERQTLASQIAPSMDLMGRKVVMPQTGADAPVGNAPGSGSRSSNVPQASSAPASSNQSGNASGYAPPATPKPAAPPAPSLSPAQPTSNSQMTMIIVSCVVAFFVLVGGGVGAWLMTQGPSSANAIFHKVSPSVVRLIIDKGDFMSFGSGFFAEPDLVVTNRHVAKGYKGGLAKVIDQSGSFGIAQVIYIDPKVDLAILYVPGTNAPPLKLADHGAAKIGETVFAIGSPGGSIPANLLSDDQSSTEMGGRLVPPPAVIPIPNAPPSPSIVPSRQPVIAQAPPVIAPAPTPEAAPAPAPAPTPPSSPSQRDEQRSEFEHHIFEGVMSPGMITTEYLSGGVYIQHNAPISHGNSGGPLFNSHGEVIGVNTLGFDECKLNGIYMAIDSKYVKDVLNKPEVQEALEKIREQSAASHELR